MRRALVLAMLALACGPQAGRSGRGEPVPPGAPYPGAAPSEGAPAVSPGAAAPSLALPCHVEEDLAPPSAVTCACPPARELGSPVEARIPRYQTGCDDEVKVDGAGTLSAYATVGLGGGGYWRGELVFARGDGTLARGPFGVAHSASAAGPHGLLAFLDPWDVKAYDSAGALVATGKIEWPMALAQWFWPSAYLGFHGAGPDGDGGLVLALAGVGGDGGLELWLAHLRADARLATVPFLAIALPAPAPDFARDRYATAARKALGKVVVGRDGDGRFLVLWDGQAACGAGTIAGRWFAPDGAALGPVFRAAADVQIPDPLDAWNLHTALVRLLDGSLALQHHDGRWIRRFAEGVPAGGAVPEWLAARPGERLAAVPGGGVLAAIRAAAASPQRRPVVALVAASGEVCAEHVLPAQPPPTYDSPDVVEVGADGTIVQSAGTECDPAFELAWCAHVLCVYRSWPAALP